MSKIPAFLQPYQRFFRLFRFGLVGASGTIVNTLLLWLFKEKLDIHYTLAGIIAIYIAMFNNFIWNDLWTWSDRQEIKKEKSFIQRLLQYFTVATIAALTQWGTLRFFTEFANLHYLLANLLGILAGLAFNYIINDKWTFGKEQLHKNYHYLFWTLLLLTTNLRLLYITQLDLIPDESYYWEWSRNLDFSFYDQPPFIAYIIALFTFLGGHTEFALRIGAVLVSFGMTWWIYLLGKEAYNIKIGFFAALTLNAIMLYSIGGILMLQDVPQLFFWGLSTLFLYRALFKNKNYWYLLGITLGFGILSKYTMVLFIPCTVLFVILSKEHRKLLWSKETYLSLLIALLIFSPVIYWNYKNEWASFLFQVHHGTSGESIDLRKFGDYWGGQLGVVTPFIFLGIFLSWIIGFYRGLKYKENKSLFFTCLSAPIVLFFAYTNLRTRGEANWAASAYFTGTLYAVALFVNWIEKGKGWAKKWAYIALISGYSFTLLVLLYAIYPIIPLTARQMEKDPTNRLYGWRTLGEEAEKRYKNLEYNENNFIFSRRYQTASELAFYIPSHPRLYSFNLGSRANQYDFWEKPKAGGNALFIYDKHHCGELHSDFEKLFDRMELAEPILIYKQDKIIKTFIVYYCYGYKGWVIGE